MAWVWRGALVIALSLSGSARADTGDAPTDDTTTDDTTTGETSDAGDTGDASTGGPPREPIHDSTMGTPLYEGPADNDPPVVVTLDDDGFCRVNSDRPGAPVAVMSFALLAFARRRR